jgi:hypothetical protein
MRRIMRKIKKKVMIKFVTRRLTNPPELCSFSLNKSKGGRVAGTIKINVEGKTTVDLKTLIPFQGKLKHIEKAEYEKLRKVIIDQGISFTWHIWQHKGKNYIIDGHQRTFTLTQMVKIEGWKCPKVPVSIVKAKSFKEAKLKVLAGASQYGKLSKDGLLEFLKENDIDFDEIVSDFHFPELDFADLMEDLALPDEDDLTVVDPPSETAKSKSGSDQVKQLQLFFALADFTEFINLLDDLKVVHETENISDTLLEVVRESHKALKKKK